MAAAIMKVSRGCDIHACNDWVLWHAYFSLRGCVNARDMLPLTDGRWYESKKLSCDSNMDVLKSGDHYAAIDLIEGEQPTDRVDKGVRPVPIPLD